MKRYFRWLIYPWIGICVLAFLPALFVIWLSHLMGLGMFKDSTEEPDFSQKKRRKLCGGIQ